MRHSTARGGFSRIDLTAVLGLSVVAVGICLPALAHTQEAAKRSRCQQNLQSLSAAIQQYADANDDYLPDCHRFKTPLRGWVTLLLPYLGEQKIYDQYDW
ncbi:MAG TPA: DUF1559 domain-containing protein, partial [Gemmataceae bacterium]|nr:DUF1559 domain-containing protein [Gemmataceae bacterium]